MGKKKYLEVTETLREINQEMFSRSLVELMANLQGFKDDYPDHKDLHITIEKSYCDAPDDFYLEGTRLETDEERDKRLDWALHTRKLKIEAKAEQEAAEKAELKRLLEKYGEELIQ